MTLEHGRVVVRIFVQNTCGTKDLIELQYSNLQSHKLKFYNESSKQLRVTSKTQKNMNCYEQYFVMFVIFTYYLKTKQVGKHLSTREFITRFAEL